MLRLLWRLRNVRLRSNRKSMSTSLLQLRSLGFVPRGILDVGAFEGKFSLRVRKIWENSHILMIDALAENEPILAAVSTQIGNAGYIIAMLGEEETDSTAFFVVDTEMRPDIGKTGSSKYKENNNFPMKERQIRQSTLERIVESRDKTYEMIKLDVQGAELDVLKGLGRYISHVEVILMEMSLVNYNEGAPLIDKALSVLNTFGFVLYDIVKEHRFGGCLFQVDGLFVRPTSRFRPQPPFFIDRGSEPELKLADRPRGA